MEVTARRLDTVNLRLAPKESASDTQGNAGQGDGRVCLQTAAPWFHADLPTRRRSVDEVDTDLRCVIRELVNGKLPWPFFLYGEAGSGKSCAALCMTDRFGGWYTKLADLARMFIAAQREELRWSTGYLRTESELWGSWTRAPFAVLDEVGRREDVSGFQRELLTDLIDKRCEQHATSRPTVFVSNLQLEQVFDVYGDRIASRLAAGTQYATRGDRRLKVVSA